MHYMYMCMYVYEKTNTSVFRQPITIQLEIHAHRLAYSISALHVTHRVFGGPRGDLDHDIGAEDVG